MPLDRELFEVSKVLLAESDSDKTTEIVLRRLVETAGADRGFVVVREDGAFEQKLGVRYDRERVPPPERRFSRTLVREAIQTQVPVYVPNLLEDARFAMGESTQALGPCSILVVPLRHAGEVYGAVYLDRRQPGGFGEDERVFARELAEVAGLFLLRALERDALEQRNRSLERDLFSQHRFEGIVTRHPKMLQVLELVAQVADSDATVLVLGETGTGKELIARALHVNSRRRSRPFVTLHCSALPATLLEAELFGHVAGAFTDARRERSGRIAAAHGGTLFLDEVGEIPLETQAKLLRFLQFGEIQRLGSDKVEKVDVRIVAATHRDLRRLCQEGKLREDLYFRLRVLDLTLPPLRERKSDVLVLADSFLRRHWRRPGEMPRWMPAAERALVAWDYPGNVRELSHLVERVCLLARGPELGLDLFPPEVVAIMSATPAGPPEWTDLTGEGLQLAKDAAAAEVERRFLQELMARSEGNVSRAARAAGMHRSFLQKLLVRHRLGSGPWAADAGGDV
jgi:Nif-specific regulatory protein/two-component system response regulator HydG